MLLTVMLSLLTGCTNPTATIDLYCLKTKPLLLSDNEFAGMTLQQRMTIAENNWLYACTCLEQKPEGCR